MLNKHILLIIALLTLNASGCKSTTPLANQASVNEALESNNRQNVKSSLTFYNQLQSALNEKDQTFLLPLIKQSAVAQHATSLVDSQALVAMYGVDWQKTFVEALKKLVLLANVDLNWQYLYRGPHENSQFERVFFRLLIGDHTRYCEFVIDKSHQNIIDISFATLSNSTIGFLTRYATTYFSIGNEHGLANQTQLGKFLTSIKNLTKEEFVEQFSQLPVVVKTNPVIVDFIFRAIEQFPEEQQAYLQLALAETLAQDNVLHPMMEPYFVENKQYDTAIKLVNSLPDYALNDYFYQAEIGALFALSGDFNKAIFHGHRAVIHAPNESMAFFMLLFVAVQSEQYQIATQAISVLETKFDIRITDDVINGLQNGDKLIASEHYIQWLQQNNKSSS